MKFLDTLTLSKLDIKNDRRSPQIIIPKTCVSLQNSSSHRIKSIRFKNTRLHKYLYTFKDCLIKLKTTLQEVGIRECMAEFCIPGNALNSSTSL